MYNRPFSKLPISLEVPEPRNQRYPCLDEIWCPQHIKETIYGDPTNSPLKCVQAIGVLDWYAALQEILTQKELLNGNQPSAESQPVMPCFLTQMQEKFSKMTQGAKWILPSGATVEDKMFAFATNLDYEHPAHSFILDMQDKCWEDVFSKDDIEHMSSVAQLELPEIDDPDVVSFVGSFNGQHCGRIVADSFTASIHNRRAILFDVVKQSILNACMAYKAELFHRPLSETDMILHLWSPITYCYGDTNIAVNTGERESKATSVGRNTDRALNTRKLHGAKIDMKFTWETYELGCAEVGRVDDGEIGTNEMRESKLKCPKTMRDMLVVLSRSFPSRAKSLRTFGYIMMGRTVSLAVMDNPGGNVCRIVRSLRNPIPELASGFVARGLPLLLLYLQVKQMMSDMVSQLDTYPPSNIQLGKSLPATDMSFSVRSPPSSTSSLTGSLSSRSSQSALRISSDQSSTSTTSSNKKRKLSALSIP